MEYINSIKSGRGAYFRNPRPTSLPTSLAHSHIISNRSSVTHFTLPRSAPLISQSIFHDILRASGQREAPRSSTLTGALEGSYDLQPTGKSTIADEGDLVSIPPRQLRVVDDEWLGDPGEVTIADTGIRLYHRTKDPDKESEVIRIHYPASFSHELDRILREDLSKSFLTKHQLVLNLTQIGLVTLKEHGFPDLDHAIRSFEGWLRSQDSLAMTEATATMLANYQQAYKKAFTPSLRAKVIASIYEEVAKWEIEDVEIANKLKLIAQGLDY